MFTIPTRFGLILIVGSLAVPAAARADCGAIDPRTYGATGNGCTDDRNAIQQAADIAASACGGAGGYVALSPGKYRINSKIHLPPNVGMIGTSPIQSQILVSDQACFPNPATFNMAETEVIRLDPVPSLPTTVNASTAPISGFGITFTQPDTDDRDKMTRYPFAIRGDSRPYMRFSNVWITNAWDGISLQSDALNNSGGSTFTDMYLSVYNFGFYIEKAEDSIRISRLECAPNPLMGAAAENQAKAMSTPNTVCIRAGRALDLHVTDSTFLSNTGVHVAPSVNGFTFGSIVASDFDGGAQLRVEAGTLNVSSSTFTNGGEGPAVVITGGDVRINGGWILDHTGELLPNPATIQVTGWTSSLILSDTTISRSDIVISNHFVDRTLVLATGAGNVRLENLLFRSGSSNPVAPTRPVIKFADGSRGSVVNCFMHDAFAAVPGVFFEATQDAWVSVIGNQFMNWKLVLPPNTLTITARLNNGLAAGSSPQRDASF